MNHPLPKGEGQGEGFKNFLFWAVITAGIFLRFHALDRQSLWDDEMSSIQTISTPWSQVLHTFRTYETHPPLYFLQLRIWKAVGMGSLVKLRANSVCWAALSLFLIYKVGRRYGGSRLGLLAMTLLALSPFHLAYSQEMRPYAMAVALGLAGLLALENFLSSDQSAENNRDRAGQRNAFLVLSAIWTLQLYTHYWGAFVVLAQAVYGWFAADTIRRRKGVAAAAMTSGLGFAIWLPVLADQLGVASRLMFWVPAPSPANLGKVFLAFSGIFFNMASNVFYQPGRVWEMAVLALLFGAMLIRGIVFGPRAAVYWLGIGLGVPWILSYWKPSVFVWYRYPIHILPAFILLVAAGLTGKREKHSEDSRRSIRAHLSRALSVAIGTVLVASQARGDWRYFHAWQKANPKAVVAYVHRIRQPGSLVIRPAYFANLFNFYDQGTTLSMNEDELDSADARAALKGRRLIFLAFDVPADPVGVALLNEFEPVSARYFPGTSHLGITVYELR